MALPRNSLAAGLLLAGLFATPAAAEDYAVNYMSHSDSITLGLGDAPTSNIIIQHPTPWPSYVNNTRIRTPSQQGLNALDNMMLQYLPGGGRTEFQTMEDPVSTAPGALPAKQGDSTGTSGGN